jgi:hypothetical protein
VLETGRGVHAGLSKRAVDDAKFHRGEGENGPFRN